MLYDFNWLRPGKEFPPKDEADRIERYRQNDLLFKGEHFDPRTGHNMYEMSITRLLETSETLDTSVCFPILLNYQKLISLKKADLVCGEEPEITGIDSKYNDMLTLLRQEIGFDSKLYATVIDLSRYGDAVWRVFKDENTGKGTFTTWSPANWYPIVATDGTNRILCHVLAWRHNYGTKGNPKWRLHIQQHDAREGKGGYYIQQTYAMDSNGVVIGQLLESTRVLTGLKDCAVKHISSITTTGNVYGYDDYVPIDSLLAEIMTRIAQIAKILDKHAAPAMTGPVTMLMTDPKTGERYFRMDQFYAVSPGEEQPKYLTWDGQLDAAFKELGVLFKQLYIITEMGDAILGAAEGTGQAISGTAMRSKMAAPLITVRRLTNVLTYPVKQLLSDVTSIGREFIPAEQISIEWNDGLPTDPREDAELALLLTGATSLMPVDEAIQEYLHKTVAEAQEWRKQILKDQEDFSAVKAQFNTPTPNTGNKNGSNVSSNKKGSDQGLSDFHGINN